MTRKRKDLIRKLLKGIETGDPSSVAVVSPDKYIQHNPQTREGGEGLAALFKRLSKTSPRVNIVRAFSDGDFVFAHTEYDFASAKIGFEVFRFEDDLAVEHWDNIQERQGPNPSGHSMVDGPTEATNLERTEINREFVHDFVDQVLISGRLEKLELYIDGEGFTEHNPRRADGVSAMHEALKNHSEESAAVHYDRNHRILAEGNFVLSVSEGTRGGAHTAFYDLFRVERGRIAEHWDTVEAIAPRSEWKNNNGKF